MRGEGRGEGLLFEFAEEHLEYPVEIFDDLVVPDANHAITEGMEFSVASSVLWTFEVLAAVEFDDQAPLATNEVDIVPIDGLLADKLEAAQLPCANACPQRKFCWCECPAQRLRTLSTSLVLASQRDKSSCVGCVPLTQPSPRKRGEGGYFLSASVARSVQSEVGDVARVLFEFAAFDLFDDVDETRVGARLNPDLLALAHNKAIEIFDLGARPLAISWPIEGR